MNYQEGINWNDTLMFDVTPWKYHESFGFNVGSKKKLSIIL